MTVEVRAVINKNIVHKVLIKYYICNVAAQKMCNIQCLGCLAGL